MPKPMTAEDAANNVVALWEASSLNVVTRYLADWEQQIRADERERCAKVAEGDHAADLGVVCCAAAIAKAIRALGEKEKRK
jgi:hypothetical protein